MSETCIKAMLERNKEVNTYQADQFVYRVHKVFALKMILSVLVMTYAMSDDSFFVKKHYYPIIPSASP